MAIFEHKWLKSMGKLDATNINARFPGTCADWITPCQFYDISVYYNAISNDAKYGGRKRKQYGTDDAEEIKIEIDAINEMNK